MSPIDFTQAALLIAAVFAVTEQVKRIFPNLHAAVVQVVSIVVGIAVTATIAHSTWGSTQIVNGVHLDKVNNAGIAIVGLMIAGGANLAHKIFGANGAVANIGQNKPPE